MEAIYSHVPTLTEINGTGYIIQRNIAHALWLWLKNLTTFSNFKAREILIKIFFFHLGADWCDKKTNIELEFYNF
jgi:hypothetical protein